MTAPVARTTDALAVDFLESLDYALLERLLQVIGPSGAVVGTASIEDQETRWRFTPGEPWKPGNYRLQIDTSLEDLAGNRVGRAFDVDTFDRVSKQLTRQTVSLPFRVR